MAAPRDDSESTRLDAILGAYYDASARGEAPDREAWIARHPEFAGDLAAFFDHQDRWHALAMPLRGPDDLLGPLPIEFGGYRLEGVLGRGGMGVVYHATQLVPARAVAIKVIPGGPGADEEALRRFRNEAEAAAALDHPHIVPVYEVGVHAGIPFFSMKRIEGSDLSRCLGRFRDPAAAARLVLAVAGAVEHAHRRGVLHRDLKPSNILIDAEGRPHVTDFGLAKREAADVESTRTGAILGTPAYMAPEQAEARKDAITTATDVHGLGAILYALLAGRAPFAAGSALASLERLRAGPPDSFASQGLSIPRDLETIARKCLEPDPARRYSSAGTLADDLDRFLRGDPIAARPVGPLEYLARWGRRNPAVAGLSMAVAALALAGVAGMAAASIRLANERRALVSQERRASKHLDNAINGITTLINRTYEPSLGRMPEMVALREDYQKLGLKLFRQMIANDSADPQARADSASALQHISRLHFIEGDLAEADAALDAAILLLDGLAVEQPDHAGNIGMIGQCHHIYALQHAAFGQREGIAEHCRRASDAYNRAIALAPDDPILINYLAWFLSIAPDPSFRDPPRAARLARHGLGFAPNSAGLWNDLGAALYRAGEWSEAIHAFDRARGIRRDPDNANDGFLLAMALQRAGHEADARERFRRAVAWMDRYDSRHHELIAFRAEAASELGLPAPEFPWIRGDSSPVDPTMP